LVCHGGLFFSRHFCTLATQRIVVLFSNSKYKEVAYIQHPTDVAGLTAEQLAEQFAQTTYGFQEAFFTSLSKHYADESARDQARSYRKLARLLSALSPIMTSAQALLEEIWRICEPHTKNN
jgi:hypothetical protein